MRKEKLLVTSNFSFSQNIFHSYKSIVRQNVTLYGNGLRIILADGQFQTYGMLLGITHKTTRQAYMYVEN